jgi:GGDEF domain-containing protein
MEKTIRMSTLQSTVLETPSMRQFFFEQAEVELKRAERYRVFVSLIVLDVSVIQRITDDRRPVVVREVEALARRSVRACDYVSVCGKGCLVALFPETSRQGAELAARRLSEHIRARISDLTGGEFDEVVPLEMASYPDAAGAQSVAALLHDLADRNRN